MKIEGGSDAHDWPTKLVAMVISPALLAWAAQANEHQLCL